jgi:hypothetical protein
MEGEKKREEDFPLEVSLPVFNLFIDFSIPVTSVELREYVQGRTV